MHRETQRHGLLSLRKTGQAPVLLLVYGWDLGLVYNRPPHQAIAAVA